MGRRPNTSKISQSVQSVKGNTTLLHKIIGLYKLHLYILYRIPLDKALGICYIIVTKGKPHVHIEGPLATQRNGENVYLPRICRKEKLRHTSYLAYENVEWFDERKRTDDESRRGRGRTNRKKER